MRISFVWCLLFVALKGYTQKLKITPLNEKLSVYTTYQVYNGEKVSANSMYLVTSEGVVLFDSPWDQNENQPLLDSIERKHNKKVIMVFATHSHEDRAGGFAFFNKKGIPTYALKETNAILKSKNKAVSTHTFKKDEIFEIGKEMFQMAYFGAGHTKDNVVVWFPNYNILNGGCLIKSSGAENLGNISEADLVAWPNTIMAIKAKHPQINIVIAGHDNWEASGALDKTLELLRKNRN